MKDRKIFSLIITAIVFFSSAVWLYFNSTNYYAFFLPHASAPKSMDAFNPRVYSTPSKTAQAVPISAIILALVVLILIIATLLYLKKHLHRRIVRK